MVGGGLCLKVKPNYIFLDFVLDLAALVLVVIVVVSRLEFSLQNGVPGALILSYQACT